MEITNEFDKSRINDILAGDKIRTQNFTAIGLSPWLSIINCDFNMNTTIYRALKMKAMFSLKIIYDYLFKKVNNRKYYTYVIMDLKYLLNTEFKSAITNFFDEDQDERNDLDRTKYCNMENLFIDSDVDQFSCF